MSIQCEDCDDSMQKIELIDRGHNGVNFDFEYRLEDSRPSFWTGRYPVAGKVHAYMCRKCGRIRLYGMDVDGTRLRNDPLKKDE